MAHCSRVKEPVSSQNVLSSKRAVFCVGWETIRGIECIKHPATTLKFGTSGACWHRQKNQLREVAGGRWASGDVWRRVAAGPAVTGGHWASCDVWRRVAAGPAVTSDGGWPLGQRWRLTAGGRWASCDVWRRVAARPAVTFDAGVLPGVQQILTREARFLNRKQTKQGASHKLCYFNLFLYLLNERKMFWEGWFL